jgi:putative peptide zinc metalloprotease protein
VTNDTCSVSRQDRVSLLREVPALAPLPLEAISSLAVGLTEESFRAGDVVITEGKVGDRLYLVAAGQAEATTARLAGSTALELYQPGELFGELALLSASHVRQATVTATTDLLTLSLDVEDFERMLVAYPAAQEAFEQASRHLLVVKFLKAASPFTKLDLERVRKLAEKLQPLTVDAGDDVIRQGEPGESCYLLQSGTVRVLIGTEEGEREIASLEPGAIIGEAALLTDTPRNATVRAAERCDLLELHRPDLVKVVGSDQEIGHELVDLIQLRDRPRQVKDIIAGQRRSSDGTIVTTLKDPRRAAYFRLSPGGAFVWERLDGEHTLRDLTMAYMEAFKSFAPQMISEVIQGLAASGFVHIRALRRDVITSATGRPSSLTRTVRIAVSLIDWRVSLPNPDPWLSRLFRSAIWLLFTRPAQIALAALGVGGLGFFIANLGAADHADSVGGWVLLLFFVMYFLMIVLHESGHAFTVKFFRREVLRAGVGWYWFGPMAYADTSDMWMADRWPRIVVTLGGLYASVLVASASTILAVLIGASVWAALLWQLAFLSYYVVVLNLNPLLELDGYFLLIDYLDHPNLREHCLSWLGNDLPRALRDRAELAKHKLELSYGLAAVLYVVFSGFLFLAVYRLTIQDWLGYMLPLDAAAIVGWLFTSTLVALTLVTIVSELRGSRRGVT